MNTIPPQAMSGGITFRVLSFAGGAAMVVNGTLGIFGNGGMMNTLINFYEVAFGLLAVCLEGNHQVSQPTYLSLTNATVSCSTHTRPCPLQKLPEQLKAFLFEWVHLVTMLTGRGIVYVLIGGIITAAQPWTNMIVGLYVVFIGFMNMYVLGTQANVYSDWCANPRLRRVC